jgi:hypothetical protein
VRLEADGEAVVRHARVRDDVREDREHALRLRRVRRTGVVVVDREARGRGCVLERSLESGADEAEVGREGLAAAVGGDGRPDVLLLHTLQSSHAAGDAVADDLVDNVPRRHSGSM